MNNYRQTGSRAFAKPNFMDDIYYPCHEIREVVKIECPIAIGDYFQPPSST